MTDAPRYRLVGYDIGTAPDENGGWVHWTDHEAIVARLTAERDAALAGWDDQKQRHHECWVESVKTLYRALDAEAELAPTGPVRTVTRKEIVPGVYGKVSIHQLRGDNGQVYLALLSCPADKVNTAHVQMTATELRAAVATLSEIADALEGGAA